MQTPTKIQKAMPATAIGLAKAPVKTLAMPKLDLQRSIDTVARRIGWVLPKPIYDIFSKQIEYTELKAEDHRKFIGLAFGNAPFVGLLFAAGAQMYFQETLYAIAGFFGGTVFFLWLFHLWLSILADKKAKTVEVALPDALQLIASNIKSGLTTERALLVSARPEFGALEKELKLISTEVMTGTPLTEALLNVSFRIKSQVIAITTWLIAKGISAGGQMADLLMEMSDSLRDEQSLKAEAEANVSIYVMMILATAVFGAPALYGVSTFIAEVLMTQQIEMPAGASGLRGSAPGVGSVLSSFMTAKQSTIGADFILFFTFALLVVGAFFASMIISVIVTGKEKNAVSYFPAMVIVSFVVFYIVRIALINVFGAIILGM